jgi:Amt family ammonium transporter
LLGVQSLACICLLSWGIVTSIILLWSINKFVTIRMEVHAELLGADLTEHSVKHGNVNVNSNTDTLLVR